MSECQSVSPVPTGARASCLDGENSSAQNPVQKGKYRLGRRYSLGRNKNYVYVYRRGKAFHSRNIVLIYFAGKSMTEPDDLKVGFSISSKVGNAVTRNRLRRRMKEDFRMIRYKLSPGRYIFVAKQSAAGAANAGMAQDMHYLLRKADLFLHSGE